MKALKIGDAAPNFELLNQDSVLISLKDFIGKWVVLYFYPKDNTPGCTTEACDFSQNYEKFAQKNALIIGISPDSPQSHAKFMEKFKLQHILLSDSDKEAAKAYGAWGLKKNYGKEYEGLIRSTFVIDPQGKIAQIYSPVRVKDHALKVLEGL
ncbi:thioredoxin-dependent thiol peroxidase [Campylobacter sp.]|uniref:thioredoxin-dependent thiol peroxidase n=1 Tax=Campylobacter sp. TaxID=205 RepID=UPI0026DA98A8|nr:thioredoxin-dependent thiol peroxidase [Campylobacter sp.]MDO4674647.1 thioredoxin-dependent thiol peroxidase [Campylobacter sp.]